jgi:ankyrin repeat protein
MIRAAYKGNTETTKMLINAGGALNNQDKWGNSALIYAAKRNKPEIA